MRRRFRRRNLKKQRIIITLSMIICLLIFSIGYAAFQTLIRINVKGNIKRDEACVVNNTWEYDYENDMVYELRIPCSGTYKLETWGAQGGSANDHDGNDSVRGGYGGYSAGNITLNRNNKLYVVVGGAGTTAYYSTAIGGYNGGGEARVNSSSASGDESGSGGGATHVALNSNLGVLKNYNNSKSSVLVVAGGGGGAYYYDNTSKAISQGGDAGGYQGSNPTNPICTWTGRNYYSDTVSNQQNGGGNMACAAQTYGNQVIDDRNSSFGSGGKSELGSYWHSGGGAGYYGGGYGWVTGSGGGSSYIGNLSSERAMFCYGCVESLDLNLPNIFTVSTTGESNYRDTVNCPDGFSENPISKCAKVGNGYAKITLLSRS